MRTRVVMLAAASMCFPAAIIAQSMPTPIQSATPAPTPTPTETPSPASTQAPASVPAKNQINHFGDLYMKNDRYPATCGILHSYEEDHKPEQVEFSCSSQKEFASIFSIAPSLAPQCSAQGKRWVCLVIKR